MKGLIGCEVSQSVTHEFRKRGHVFFSNDLKPCGGYNSEYHIQGDVIDAINSDYWDFIGLHPVCTKMTVSSNAHYGFDKQKHIERLESVEWTIKLWEMACKKSKRVYMENPIGVLNTDSRLPKPQIISPHYFGENARKPTCLWLHGLPKLVWARSSDLFQEQTFVYPEIITMQSKKTGRIRTYSKWEYEASCAHHEKRAEIRSKTFTGIAKAMADQWG